MNSPSRILMLTPRYAPAVGGVEKHVEMLSKKLIESGLKVTLLTCKHEKDLASSENREGIQLFRIPYGWDKNPFLTYAWILKNHKKFISNDIIHVHDTMPLLTWYFPLRLLYPTKPVYVTFHGYERDPVPMNFILLRKIAKRLARGVLCIGFFIEKVYDVKCDKTSVGAVELQDFSEKQRKGAVYIGRLERDIGIERYIETIHLLEKDAGIRMSFTLCGSGSIEGELQELADSLGIDTKFLGVVTNPLEILASKTVCFAGGYLSILEANATGTPVITITRSHLKNQYYKAMREAGGLISIQTSPEGIVKEIVRLQKSPTLLKTISIAGRTYAEKTTWNHLMNQYKELWSLSH